MDNKQKQRVIGIIFLVILAVVAIPAFLKRPGNTNEISNVQGMPSAMPVEPLKEESQGIDQNQGQNATEALEPSPMPPLEPTNQEPASQEPPVNNQGAVAGMPEQNQEPVSMPEPVPGPELQPVQPQQDLANPASTSPIPAPIPAPAPAAVVMPKNTAPQSKPHKSEVSAVKSDWVIRLAVLSTRSAADKLILDMKKQGYTGHSEEINTYKGRVYNITMKTHASKKEVDKLAQKLNTLFHIKVMVSKRR